MKVFFAHRTRITQAVVVACAILSGGCAELGCPRIDPTGERIFAPSPQPQNPGYRESPAGQLPWDMVDLLLTPRATVAPVGSEVVLLAGVQGSDNYLRTNERVEWLIASGSVGEFVDVDRGTFWDVLVGDFTFPKKVSSTYAIGSTSRRYLRLTRGTPTPSDDVHVARGQTWVTVTSPIEGTTHVTAYSREVYGWDRHKQTAVIHWVDAQWRFPPPAIVPAGGRHVLATTVTRQTDQSPSTGWRVKYTISGGPPAGFAPSGAQTVEVETNASGQAIAEILQTRPTAGTNRVDIQVIRPPQIGVPPGTGFVLGTGSAMVTWSAPGLSLRKSGPAVGSVNATLTYRIEVSNSGDLPAEGVVVADEIPLGTSYASSNPQGQLVDGRVQWQVGRLGPGERRVFEVNLRAERVGTIAPCAEATTSSGLRAKDCASTTVSLAPPAAVGPPGTLPSFPATPPGLPSTPGPLAPPTGPWFPGQPPGLEVKVVGPDRATVGDKVTFSIYLTNRGQTTLTGLTISDVFDPGLVHEKARYENEIRRPLPGGIAPGDTVQIDVDFQVAKAGVLSHTVEVTGPAGLRASQKKYLTAVEGQVPPFGPTPPGPTPPGPTPPPGVRDQISLKLSADRTWATVGQRVLFTIDVGNERLQALTSVKVTASLDPALKPAEATENFQKEATGLSWTLPTLTSAEPRQFQISCTCQQEAAYAAIRVQVTSQQGAQAQDSLSVAIRPAGAAAPGPAAPGTTGLTVSIRTMSEPVAVGRELTYIVKVGNEGPRDENQVALTVELPPEMILNRLVTTGPTQPSVKGQTVTFDPKARVARGETLEYRVRAQARKPGKVRVQARVTSLDVREPVVDEVRTTIEGG